MRRKLLPLVGVLFIILSIIGLTYTATVQASWWWPDTDQYVWDCPPNCPDPD